MSSKKLLILGFGGHARSVGNLALTCGYEELLFWEPSAKANENFLGHPVVSSLGILDATWRHAFASSGNGAQRLTQVEFILAAGFELVSLISPSASIAYGAYIDSGSFVGSQAYVGPLAKIGRCSIINTGSIVEHESIVGEFAHVSINASLAGRSRIGAFSMLGAGAIVKDGIEIVDNVTIGAGAVVVQNIQKAGVYVGVPARLLNDE